MSQVVSTYTFIWVIPHGLKQQQLSQTMHKLEHLDKVQYKLFPFGVVVSPIEISKTEYPVTTG